MSAREQNTLVQVKQYAAVNGPILAHFYSKTSETQKQTADRILQSSTTKNVPFLRINVDCGQEVAKHFNVYQVPTLILIDKQMTAIFSRKGDSQSIVQEMLDKAVQYKAKQSQKNQKDQKEQQK